jgi:hypothetical protein
MALSRADAHSSTLQPDEVIVDVGRLTDTPLLSSEPKQDKYTKNTYTQLLTPLPNSDPT